MKEGMKIKVITLTREIMEETVDQLVMLDRECIRDMGERFCTFPWERENFLRDLKGKWILSQAAFDKDDILAGAWVASSTVPLVCHTHRVVVFDRFRGQGVADKLFQACKGKAREIGMRKMTVEAGCMNEGALRFYKKEGFSLLDPEQIAGYLKDRNRAAVIMSDHLQEEDGSRYFVLQRQL